MCVSPQERALHAAPALSEREPLKVIKPHQHPRREVERPTHPPIGLLGEHPRHLKALTSDLKRAPTLSPSR